VHYTGVSSVSSAPAAGLPSSEATVKNPIYGEAKMVQAMRQEITKAHYITSSQELKFTSKHITT
jgi:hypothetical protein